MEEIYKKEEQVLEDKGDLHLRDLPGETDPGESSETSSETTEV